MTKILYVVFCGIALVYLTFSNAQGYVPFAARLARTPEHTPNHFHK